MYKLAVFDVDGTLVTRKDRVLLASTIQALKTLKQNGVAIAIASGRPPFAMEKSLLDQIDFDYFICSNGTYVMDAQYKPLYIETMSATCVESLALDFVKHDDAIMFQFEDKAYCYNGLKRISHMLSHCLGRLDLLADDRETTSRHLQSLPFAAVSKISASNLAYYEMRYPSYRFESFLEDYYDIYPFSCTKATGIMHLCETIAITMEDVICFGDALNDVEMLKACGCGVAMGDGLKEAKEAADYVTSQSEEDGIYNACCHFKLL